MKCVRCKNECLNDELVNGYCYDCRKYLEIDEENTNSLKYENITNEIGNKISISSSIIKYLGIILSVVGAIIYIIEMDGNDYGIFFGIVAGFIGIVTFYFIGLLLDSLAEILNLLENIKNK